MRMQMRSVNRGTRRGRGLVVSGGVISRAGLGMVRLGMQHFVFLHFFSIRSIVLRYHGYHRLKRWNRY